MGLWTRDCAQCGVSLGDKYVEGTSPNYVKSYTDAEGLWKHQIALCEGNMTTL